MSLNKKDCIYELTQGGTCEEVPSSPLVGFHSVRLYNKNIKEVCYDSTLMKELQLKAANFYDLYIIFNFMDLTLEPEALGAEVFWKGEIPSIGKNLPYDHAEKILETASSNFIHSKRIEININLIRSLSENGNFAIGAYVSGPLTLIAQTFGVTKTLKQIKKSPQHLENLLKMASNIIKVYIDSMVEANADVIMILEPVGALLSPRMFISMERDILKDILGHINNKGIISALHICGDTNHLVDLMLETKPHILSIDKQVDASEPLKRDKNVVVLGNVGTVELQQDSPENIYKISMEILKKTEGLRHILSSGCDVPVYSKPENIKMIAKAAKDWSKEKSKP